MFIVTEYAALNALFVYSPVIQENRSEIPICSQIWLHRIETSVSYSNCVHLFKLNLISLQVFYAFIIEINTIFS